MALTLLVASGLAGCSKPAESAALAAPSPSVEGWLADADLVTDALGGIRGTVLDNTLLPVPNATITLEPGAGGDSIARGASAADGSFAFGQVAPGTLRLRTSANGFAESFTFVDVMAGTVTAVDVQLGDAPTLEPYLEVVIRSGISQCAEWGGVLGSFGIGPTLCPLGGTENHWVDVADTWRYGVWENHWADQNSNMGLVVRSGSNLGCTAENCHGSKQGSPPVRLDAEPGKIMGPNRTAGWAPYPEGAFNMSLLASYNGRYARELNQTIGPAGVCPADGCAGAGPALGVRFDLYASIFHNLAPARPDLYSALPDA